MVRVKRRNEKEKEGVEKPKRRRERDNGPTTTALELQKQRDATKKSFMLSENTRSTYDGHVKRGKNFLKRLVAERQASVSDGKESGDFQPLEDSGDPVDEALLEVAFDNPPNRHTPFALELFISEKCIQRGHSKQLCEQIYSAFKHYWKMM